MVRFFPLIISICFITTSISHATVRTVSNDLNFPAQFSSIQAAVSDSRHGDTVYIFRSRVSYGDITIDRPIVLIGAGHYSINEQTPSISEINNILINEFVCTGTCTGVMINGFLLNAVNVAFNQGTSNIMITRCRFRGSIGVGVSAGNKPRTNWIIEGCIFQDQSIINLDRIWSRNTIIRNNLFLPGSSILNGNDPSIIISNNLFFSTLHSNTNRNALFRSCNQITIANNIFYQSTRLFDNCGEITLYNNYLGASPPVIPTITYVNNISTLPNFIAYDYTSQYQIDLNGGSGNLSSFNNIKDYRQVNFFLASGSPGENAGTDDKDIGLIEGLFNKYGTPFIPHITSFTATPIVDFGSQDPINFQIKAVNRK